MLSCPKCGGTEELATVEVVEGFCRIDSEGNHDDYTEINWNSQETVKDSNGQWKFLCRGCDHEWFQQIEAQ
jgi:hypothetical protein